MAEGAGKGVVSSSGEGGRWSLHGMTALATGGTGGIGHAVVEELVRLGATVHTCSRNEAELNSCLAEWRASGFQVTGSVADAYVREGRSKLMETIAEVFGGKLNIIVTFGSLI